MTNRPVDHQPVTCPDCGHPDGYTAERERDEARDALKRFVEDSCDTDNRVRTQAKRVLPEATVDGDSYNVPSLAEIAEMLADEVVKARAAMGGA